MIGRNEVFNQSILEMNCTLNLLQAVRLLKNQMDVKAAEENRLGADLYAITIIGAFASIIILLMFRSIRPHQSLDDQVTLMMTSMQMRVEVDELARRKKKMREAKKKAQDWIKELRQRSRRSLSRSSRRSKSTNGSPPLTQEISVIQIEEKTGLLSPSRSSAKPPNSAEVEQSDGSVSTRQSICSVPTRSFLELSLPKRAKSHLGFVPEIVVTEPRTKALQSPPKGRRRSANVPVIQPAPNNHLGFSRKSSMSSYKSGCLSPSLSEEIVFQFPDSNSETPNDSPPYDI